MNKADKLCEIADQIREHLGNVGRHATQGRMDLAAIEFDRIMGLTADLKVVAHSEED